MTGCSVRHRGARRNRGGLFQEPAGRTDQLTQRWGQLSETALVTERNSL